MATDGLVLDMLKNATGKSLQCTDVEFILCGIESHVCVLQTVLDLTHAGARVHVVRDGISSCNRNEVPIAVEVRCPAHPDDARRRGYVVYFRVAPLPAPRYAYCLTPGSAAHPHFKAISGLIVRRRSHPARHESAHGPCGRDALLIA